MLDDRLRFFKEDFLHYQSRQIQHQEGNFLVMIVLMKSIGQHLEEFLSTKINCIFKFINDYMTLIWIDVIGV